MPPRRADKKNKGGDVCPVCDETIKEPDDDGNNGQDAVFCEGECQVWLHRTCAGLTAQAFSALCISQTSLIFVHIVCYPSKTIKFLSLKRQWLVFQIKLKV